MGFRTYIVALVALLAAAGCGKKPKNVIAEWRDSGNNSYYSVEAVDEKARNVTIKTRDATSILSGDGEDGDPDTLEVTVGNGPPGYFGGSGQPPLPPGSKPAYDRALAEAQRRAAARATASIPTPTATPPAPTPEPEPNILYGPKLLGDSDNVTLESLTDGTIKLTLVKGDLTWVLYDKDRDMVPETGERTISGSKPGCFGGPDQLPLPPKAEGLYRRTVEAINTELCGELDAFYPVPAAPAPGAPADPATPGSAPAPGSVFLESKVDYKAA